MKDSKIYFIGCGPGDRKLISLKGEELLKKSNLIFYFPPYDLIFQDIIQNKKKYFIFGYNTKEIQNIIDQSLKKKETISFMLPGDSTIFSPISSFLSRYSDFIEIIPGIGSLSYFAAKIKRILNPLNEIYLISLLSTKILKERFGYINFENLINPHTLLVIYMNNLSIEELSFKLKKIYPPKTPIFIGINLSLKNEKIITGKLNNITSKVKSIKIEKEKLTLIIVGDIEKIPENWKWWDKKVEEYKNKINKSL